jgi:hypothetical protein
VILIKKIQKFKSIKSTVIKPGPAGRPDGWIGLDLLKDRPVQQPGKTWSTG